MNREEKAARRVMKDILDKVQEYGTLLTTEVFSGTEVIVETYKCFGDSYKFVFDNNENVINIDIRKAMYPYEYYTRSF